ncbi:MAG: hypothetical protein KGM43_01155 [Planctomycetota bacterium]|nr:hypothetical protein [Planctomycetota bacterium]
MCDIECNHCKEVIKENAVRYGCDGSPIRYCFWCATYLRQAMLPEVSHPAKPRKFLPRYDRSRLKEIWKILTR